MIAAMTGSHPLDRPVWSALATGWAPLAEGDRTGATGSIARYGPFAAAADGTPAEPRRAGGAGAGARASSGSSNGAKFRRLRARSSSAPPRSAQMRSRDAISARRCREDGFRRLHRSGRLPKCGAGSAPVESAPTSISMTRSPGDIIVVDGEAGCRHGAANGCGSPLYRRQRRPQPAATHRGQALQAS